MLSNESPVQISLRGIVNRLTANAGLNQELFQIGLFLLWQSAEKHPGATESWHLQGCDFDLRDHLDAGRSLDAHKRRDLACQIDDLLEELCSDLEPLDCEIIRALVAGESVNQLAAALGESHQLVSWRRLRIAAVARRLGHAPTNQLGNLAYSALASLVVLAANTTYYLMSHEAAGGDYWYDYDNTLIPAGVASIPGPVYTTDGATNCSPFVSPDNGYVPVSLKFAGGWQQTNEVHYVYDGNLVLQERWLNPQVSTNTPQQLVTYTRGRDLSGSLEGAGGIGGLLARSAPSTLNPNSPQHAFYRSDGNGNVTCLINSNQAIVAKYIYDPYGNILSISGPLAEANLYRFSSKELHPSSALIYYLYRFCDSASQRWINRDPISDQGSKLRRGESIAGRFESYAVIKHPFVFCQNNALSHLDPAGLDEYSDCLTSSALPGCLAQRALILETN